MNYMPGIFLITFRRLAREKFYALICVLSLAIGVAGSMIIGLYLFHELTFDRYHKNYEQIYRVETHIGSLIAAPLTGYQITDLLVRNYPQFIDHVRFKQADERQFRAGENEQIWQDTYLADASAFKHFTFDVKYGDINTAFDDQYSIAISDSFAQFYFGDNNPIGEVVSTEQHEFRVTLVFEDLPNNTTFKYDALIPMAMLEVYRTNFANDFAENFIAMTGASYLIAANDFDPATMDAISQDTFDTYLAEGFSRAMGGIDVGTYRLAIQNLTEIHFGPNFSIDGTGGFGEGGGSIVNVYLFSAVAITLLTIGAINYINLATARASVRSREVAMRKVLGAQRDTLIKQFLLESFVFVILAVALGLFLCSLALEIAYIASFVGNTSFSTLFASPWSVAVFLLAVFTLALVAGLYPAFYLTRQSTLSNLRSKPQQQRRGLPIRQLLVLMQITVSLIIVACVLSMLRQSEFLQSSSMGFKKSDQVVVQLVGADAITAREALINELTQHPNILGATEISSVFGRGISSLSVVPVDTNNGERRNQRMYGFNVGDQFLNVMDIQLVDGVMFRREQLLNGENPVVVNETFVDEMEWDQPLGKLIGRSQVVGVIKDFHFKPLHESIEPLFLAPYNDQRFSSMSERGRARQRVDLVVSTNGIDPLETRSYIEETTRRFTNQFIIEIDSLEAMWNRLYARDTSAINLVGFFSLLSIAISLLGLAGLAAYGTQQRQKEIAIRKVLGASVNNLLALLSIDISKVLAIAILPGVLGAYYIFSLWLERFAYRVEFSFAPYIIAVLLIGAFSIFVSIAQTYRSAHASPAVKLKYE